MSNKVSNKVSSEVSGEVSGKVKGLLTSHVPRRKRGVFSRSK